MSFIEFKSAKVIDKEREELREARAAKLKEVEELAKERNKREIQKQLSGESTWMLPAVADQINELSSTSKSKKKKSKSKKKSSKKRQKNSSTDSDSDSESYDFKRVKKSKKRKQLESESESSDEWVEKKDAVQKDKKKHRKKSKKRRKEQKDSDTNSDTDGKKHKRTKKSKKKRKSSESFEDGEWVESVPVPIKDANTATLLKRDDWMTASAGLQLKTFSKERKEPIKPNERAQQIDAYDPAKSKVELNPYWKSNGTGMPGFQKPKVDDDDEVNPRPSTTNQKKPSSTRNWQKPNSVTKEPQKLSVSGSSDEDNSADSSSSESKSEAEPEPVYLNDEEMNQLAARILKADIKGNKELAIKLKHQLESARTFRAKIGKQPATATVQNQMKKKQKRVEEDEEEEHVLLTRTDASGNVRPLMKSRQADPNSLYGGRKGEKERKKQQKKKKMETHDGDGQRVRYYADDDRYSLKEMFEREKLPETKAQMESQYLHAISKNKNPNDDLEDIFNDEMRQDISQATIEERDYQRAVKEQEKLTKALDNCDRCFTSKKLNKQLLVDVGTKIYLSLPWHVGLQNGHCILTPREHVSCCTQLDEDAWEELTNYRRKLTRMFGDDLIFYEIATNLHKNPHLSVHAIPIPSSHGEGAPFFFKKAIEESEKEWSVNKQLIHLGKKSLRAAVPKGLPYVWVNFGMSSGFAHVIEDQERFPSYFVQEIIGGMLELDQNTWRKPRKEGNFKAKIESFAKKWKSFD